MTVVIATLRIFLGLDLLLNGINFWFPFIPITTPESAEARSLMKGLIDSGLFNTVKYIEIGTGLALLANRFVPLALLIMFPLTVVIFWVDCILIATAEGYLFGGTTSVVHVLLLIAHLRHFLPVLAMRASPGMPSRREISTAVAGST